MLDKYEFMFISKKQNNTFVPPNMKLKSLPIAFARQEFVLGVKFGICPRTILASFVIKQLPDGCWFNTAN